MSMCFLLTDFLHCLKERVLSFFSFVCLGGGGGGGRLNRAKKKKVMLPTVTVSGTTLVDEASVDKTLTSIE